MSRLAIVLLLVWPTTLWADPFFWRHEWPGTDFTRSAVPWIEIRSGGPPRDGIPALDDPPTVPVAAAELTPDEAVVTVARPGRPARAYPIRYLIWHEIVNDTIGRVPVAVTYCPLCNSFVVFDRRVGDRVLSFGVTGKLRHSDMVMYDRETESWWQQATGIGIVGAQTGTELDRFATWMEPFDAFAAAHPDGEVMAQPAWPRAYGRNPYDGYDGLPRPFLYSGELPPHGIAPLARVVRVGDAAWPMARIRAAGRLREDGLILSWEAGMASALDDTSVAGGRDVGHVRVRAADGGDVVHDVMFAFAFQAFHPQGVWHVTAD